MKILSEKNTPRWIIFLIDVCICIGSLLLAEFSNIPDRDVNRLVQFRGGKFCRRDALFQREKFLGDFEGDLSVVHKDFLTGGERKVNEELQSENDG